MLYDEYIGAIQQARVHTSSAVDPIELDRPICVSDEALYGKQLGCVIMAGGQATRLGLNIPKGLVELKLPEPISLFACLMQKLVFHGHTYGCMPYVAIMTSESTDEIIRDHFKKHDFFGMESEKVQFFIQSSLPLVSMEDQIVVDQSGASVMAPDGNGAIFSSFVKSGIHLLWRDVQAVSLVMVDNPALHPLLPELVIPVLDGVQMTAATVERISSEECVGIFAQREGKLCVEEYSEIDAAIRSSYNDAGLLFKWANISFFVTTVGHIQYIAGLPLPLHVAKKRVNSQWVWKGEYFVFDSLMYSKAQCIPIERKKYFMPIKSANDISAVEHALQAR